MGIPDGIMNEKSHRTQPHSSSSSTLQDEEAGEGRDASSVNGGPIEAMPSTPAGLGATLTHAVSRIRTRDSGKDPGPPPDGGLQAWSQAFLVHLVIFNTWGFINSFGLFQTYYTHTLNEPPSSIAWIGTVQIWTLFFIGTFSGRATDAGFFKLTFITGSVIQLIGIFMTSLCRTYWQVFLAHGLCVGLGNGLVFVPSVALCSVYFLRNRSLAIGIAASGTATGGLVFPAMAERLLPTVGFGWTIRVMGVVMMGIVVVCSIFLKPRLPPRKSGPIVEWAAFKELPYLLFSIGMFLIFWALYIGFFFVGSFGRDVLGTDQSTSINLLLVMNGVGFPGRIIPNYFADRTFGPMNSILPFAVIASVLLYCWIAVKGVTGLWVFAVLYGLFASGIQSLFPATLASLTTDPNKAGVRMGMIFSVAGFAVLSGPPIAGALIGRRGGSYVYAQVFAGTSMCAGFVTLIAARWAKVGWALRAKV